MPDTVRHGNYFSTSVTISDIDNPLNAQKVFVTPSDVGFTYDTTTGKININYCINNIKYSVGQTISYSIKVFDGSDTAKLQWNAVVGKHVWTKVMTNAGVYNSFAAKDSFSIFKTVDLGGPNGLLQKCDLKTTTTWTDLSLAHQGGGQFNVNKLYAYNNTLTTFGDGSYRYNATTGTLIDSAEWANGDGCIDGSGNFFASGYDGTIGDTLRIFRNSTIVFTDTNPLQYRISQFLVHPNFTFLTKSFADGSELLCRWTNPWWSNGIKNELLGYLSNNNSTILLETDNNADTVFVLDISMQVLYRFPYAKSIAQLFFQTKEDVTLATAKNPTAIKMLSGSAGWIIGSDGKLFFTNDGFASFTEEHLGSGITSSQIYMSTDRNAIFVISGDGSEIYRY
jgi:hypothetical protein